MHWSVAAAWACGCGAIDRTDHLPRKKKKKNAFRENPGDTVECFHPEKGGMLGNAIKEASQITSSEPAIFQLLSVVPVVFPQLAAVVEIPLRRPKLRLAHPRPNARQAKSCLVPGGA